MNKQAWIEYALKEGFESFEIYQSHNKEKVVSWYEGEMESYVTSRVTGTSLRGIYQGKMVNQAMEEVGDDNKEKIIASMIEQAKAITSEDKQDLRKPEETQEVKSKKNFLESDGALIQKVLKEVEEKILAYDERIIMASDISYEETSHIREIVNSYGMDVRDEERIHAVVASCAAKDGDDIKNGYYYELVEDLNQFDVDAFVKELCDEVLGKLNAHSLASGTYPIIMERRAMTALFSALADIFSGDLISKGISPLKDKLNEKIFSDLITIIDDPKNLDAVRVANYDDEGCPTRKKILVDKGEFKVILHNTKSAMRMNGESTGNGFKGSYASPVSISPMNCYIEAGEKSLEELCMEMQEGFVITSLAGLHAGIDFVTTNFSLQCAGYYVKEGKRDHSVTLVTVAANFLDLMNKVVSVGNDLEWKLNSVACPSIYFSSCAISGE